MVDGDEGDLDAKLGRQLLAPEAWKKFFKNKKNSFLQHICLWRSPDLVMVSVVVVLLLLVGATFVLSDLCTIQKNL